MALKADINGHEFRIGDTVRVHQKIQEDEKTRTQAFQGTVIAIRGEGANKSFTVRRLGSAGVGIERIFPLESPIIEKVEVVSKGFVRRAKLYYLRDKSAREVASITTKKKGVTQANRKKIKSNIKYKIKAKTKKTKGQTKSK